MIVVKSFPLKGGRCGNMVSKSYATQDYGGNRHGLTDGEMMAVSKKVAKIDMYCCDRPISCHISFVKWTFHNLYALRRLCMMRSKAGEC